MCPFLNRHLPWFVARWLARWRETTVLPFIFYTCSSYELKKQSLTYYGFRLFMVYLCIHTFRWKNDFYVRNIPDPILIYHPHTRKSNLALQNQHCVRLTNYTLWHKILHFYGLLFGHGNLLYNYHHDIEDDTGLP